ncbi:hypothetical protein ACFVVA_36980 [Kitasatospora sp. NPDC058048]|uniref:hypothetical protein n=1 Tax=Kitasatospora sp. NPDC058048 TaxID=3346313 RepID=UPI0036D98CE9
MTTHSVGARVTLTHPTGGTHHGTVRLAPLNDPTNPHPTYQVEWDISQGLTHPCSPYALAPAPARPQLQALPELQPHVRVEHTGPHSPVRRGTCTGHDGATRYTVLWDGTTQPQTEAAADLIAVDPNVLHAERCQGGGFAVGDRAETIRRFDTVASGTVMETRRFARRSYARVRWADTQLDRWHTVSDLFPLHGAHLAIEYAHRRTHGQTHAQATSVYHGDHRPAVG